ncbi:unnamed protein product, partial [Trichobilharzia regenti]
VQHERGPRNSTLRRQVALYLNDGHHKTQTNRQSNHHYHQHQLSQLSSFLPSRVPPPGTSPLSASLPSPSILSSLSMPSLLSSASMSAQSFNTNPLVGVNLSASVNLNNTGNGNIQAYDMICISFRCHNSQ